MLLGSSGFLAPALVEEQQSWMYGKKECFITQMNVLNENSISRSDSSD